MNTINTQTKAVVTVAEMARMVGLSRARFYQLMGNAFPEPSRDDESGRPYYTEDQQVVCLEVRRRNFGVDGKPILFYARRGGAESMTGKRRKPKPKAKSDAAFKPIVDAVRSLGLTGVTEQQVTEAVAQLFPNGIERVDRTEVIRSVFIELQRQNSAR